MHTNTWGGAQRDRGGERGSLAPLLRKEQQFLHMWQHTDTHNWWKQKILCLMICRWLNRNRKYCGLKEPGGETGIKKVGKQDCNKTMKAPGGFSHLYLVAHRMYECLTVFSELLQSEHSIKKGPGFCWIFAPECWQAADNRYQVNRQQKNKLQRRLWRMCSGLRDVPVLWCCVATRSILAHRVWSRCDAVARHTGVL